MDEETENAFEQLAISQIWRSSLATQTYRLVLNVTAPRNMNQGIGTPAYQKGVSSRKAVTEDPRIHAFCGVGSKVMQSWPSFSMTHRYSCWTCSSVDGARYLVTLRPTNA